MGTLPTLREKTKSGEIEECSAAQKDMTQAGTLGSSLMQLKCQLVSEYFLVFKATPEYTQNNFLYQSNFVGHALCLKPVVS